MAYKSIEKMEAEVRYAQILLRIRQHREAAGRHPSRLYRRLIGDLAASAQANRSALLADELDQIAAFLDELAARLGGRLQPPPDAAPESDP